MTTKIDTLQHLHNTYIDGHLDGEKVGLEKGLAKGLEKGLEKGRAEAFKRVEDQLRRDGMPEDEIKRILDGARK